MLYRFIFTSLENFAITDLLFKLNNKTWKKRNWQYLHKISLKTCSVNANQINGCQPTSSHKNKNSPLQKMYCS